MSNDKSADARLERLLHVLPTAMGADGADLGELARELDTTEDVILDDLDEVTSRVYYQPGGWPDDVQIFVEPDRIRVARAPGFERPAQLSSDETLCLALALRAGAAAAHMGDGDARRRLLRRVEAHLTVPTGEDTDDDSGSPLGMPDRDPDPEGIRETLMVAARDRRPCALWYVKEGADEGSVRVIHPYVIAHAEGSWYAVAHCATEDGIRVFRTDRVLAADLADGSFQVPDDFDVDRFLDGGRVFHAPEGQAVRVRYSPRIARWIRERARWDEERLEESEDGSVVVRHRVADPGWAVAHTLLYAPEAEVLEPEEVRALVRETCASVLRLGST